MNSQSELTVERAESFIGLLVAEILSAYLKLNPSQTRVQCGACVRVWKHLIGSSCFWEPRLYSNWKPRFYSNWEPRLYGNWGSILHINEVCVPTWSAWQPRLWGLRSLTYKEYVSDSTICSTVHWQKQSTTLIGSTVHRQTNQSSWQVLDWVSKTLLMIFPGGFK